MLFLKGSCSHCGEKSGFRVFAFSEYTCDLLPDAIEKSQINEPTYAYPERIKYARFFAAGTCCHCGGPALLDLKLDSDYLFALRAHITNSEKRYRGPEPEIITTWPEPVPAYSHPALPEAVRLAFVDLQQMLKQDMQPHFIIDGCRTVLESAVKALGGQGSKLHHRIEDLKSKTVVNGVLYEWATQIRHLGNDAAHDMEGTPAEAAEMVEFIKLFLQYTFEFPARVKEARGKE